MKFKNKGVEVFGEMQCSEMGTVIAFEGRFGLGIIPMERYSSGEERWFQMYLLWSAWDVVKSVEGVHECEQT